MHRSPWPAAGPDLARFACDVRREVEDAVRLQDAPDLIHRACVAIARDVLEDGHAHGVAREASGKGSARPSQTASVRDGSRRRQRATSRWKRSPATHAPAPSRVRESSGGSFGLEHSKGSGAQGRWPSAKSAQFPVPTAKSLSGSGEPRGALPVRRASAWPCAADRAGAAGGRAASTRAGVHTPVSCMRRGSIASGPAGTPWQDDAGPPTAGGGGDR